MGEDPIVTHPGVRFGTVDPFRRNLFHLSLSGGDHVPALYDSGKEFEDHKQPFQALWLCVAFSSSST